MKASIEQILDTMEDCKMRLVHVRDSMENELPKDYWMKLDTVIGKLENLEWKIVQRERK